MENLNTLSKILIIEIARLETSSSEAGNGKKLGEKLFPIFSLFLYRSNVLEHK